VLRELQSIEHEAGKSDARLARLRLRGPSADSAPALRGGAPLARLVPPEVHWLEQRLQPLCGAARLLPALTPENGAVERERLIAALERGEPLEPAFRHAPTRVPADGFRLLDSLRRMAADLPGEGLYRAKLDEVELDLMLIEAIGQPRLVRRLAARRYGDGDTIAPTAQGPMPLRRCARMILDALAPSSEPRELPATGVPGSLGSLVHELAAACGIEVQVRVDPRLSAGAATGEHTVFVAARRFGRNEARRLAVHEVLGHLLCAANGRRQPLRLLEWGTADSFVDQEGVALLAEEAAGLLDSTRLRTLAGRIVAADCMHRGASFAETSRRLHREEGFAPAEAIAIAERAYRGGGVARDVAYLLGWLRVHAAISAGEATLDELRAGRLSLSALPEVRALRELGYAREAALRPNFSRSFLSTSSGTSPRRSPPNDAASLIRLELTKK
jgi:uncharacterized protein (TIGR02421 family)